MSSAESDGEAVSEVEPGDAVGGVPSIRMRRDGPLVVTGDVVLLDAEHNPIDTGNHRRSGRDGQQNIALCRCGLSDTKPFCDGSHRGEFTS